LFGLRRKKQDKFLLLWFAVVYLVFTAIPNREWRYVTVLFPVLAISGASAIMAGLGKLQNIWQTVENSLSRRRLAKFGALMLVVFVVVGVAYSCSNAYSWVAEDHIQVPIEQATNYAALTLNENQSLMVACPLNYFNKQMVWFYLNAQVAHPNNVSQYPELAVDAYSPTFNVTEFVDLCEQNGTQYVLLYEYKVTQTYYDSTLTEQQVYDMIIGSGKFVLQASIGTAPDRIFVLKFK